MLGSHAASTSAAAAAAAFRSSLLHSSTTRRTRTCPSSSHLVPVACVRRRALLLRLKPFCSSWSKRALISLSDKTDLAILGKGLLELGYTVVSTGGTASAPENAGSSVTKVKRLSCFPEMLDGRVKTLFPHIHGGILARRDQQHHLEALDKHGIGTSDVVVVNLYPFHDKVTSVVDLKMELRMSILVVLPRSELLQRIIRVS